MRSVPSSKKGRERYTLLTFSSIQAFSGLGEAPLHGGQQPDSLSLLMQMWILSRNTLTDTPRVIFNQISGHMAQSNWQVKLTITTRHFKWELHMSINNKLKLSKALDIGIMVYIIKNKDIHMLKEIKISNQWYKWGKRRFYLCCFCYLFYLSTSALLLSTSDRQGPHLTTRPLDWYSQGLWPCHWWSYREK